MRAPRTTPPGVQAKVLKSLAESGRCLTLDELADELGVKRNRITGSVSRLVTGKYVRRQSKGCYEATPEGRAAHEKGYRPGPQGPNTGQRDPWRNTLRARVWRTLQLRKRATIPEILENATRGTEKDAYSNVLGYVRALKRAGYVRELAMRAEGTAPESNGYKIWLLIKDTGPKQPIVRKHALFDPNTKEEIAFEGEDA